MPNWGQTLLIMLMSLVVAWALQRAGYRLLLNVNLATRGFWRSFIDRTRGLVAVTLLILAVAMGAAIAPIQAWTTTIHQALLVAFVLLIGWGCVIASQTGTAFYLRRYKIDVEDNLLPASILHKPKFWSAC